MLGKIEGRRRIGRQRMVGWHHRLNGHEFELTPGDGEGQGSLACCSPWIAKSQTWPSNNNKEEAPRMKTNVDTPCVHLLTLIISVYFLPSLTQTPCPAKSFMPEACSHIPYREGLDLLFLLTKLGPTCWGVSLSLWCNGNSWLWSQRLSSAGYFLSQPQFSGL